MQVPLEIAYRGIDPNPEMDDLIREKTAKLEQVCDYMTSCRVVVEKKQEHQSSGNPFRVRLDINVPHDNRIVVTEGEGGTDMHANVYQIIRSAFKTAQRQTRELVEQQRS
ncbi:ribosome-associated translation inhibitor RaiA [candidate division KSB1 bacterium]|nr:ribosome-associated translation inhibitor RaiA [candidate division KSB1 bacterium]